MPGISHEITIDRPIEDMAELLGSDADDWLGRFASIASNTAETAARRVHGGPAAGDVRTVTFTVGDPRIDDDPALDHLTVPIRWETSGYLWLFRAFEGNIALYGLPAGGCLVRLEGSYAGRAGSVGAAQAMAARSGAGTLLKLVREAAEEQARSEA